MSRPLHVNVEVTQRGDYITGATPTAVTFLAGQATTTLSVPTNNDRADERNGTVTAKILPATNLGDDAQAAESAGQMEFTVRLSAPAPRKVTVNAATVDGDATSHTYVTAASLGQDFEAKSETITFAVAEQQKTFSVNLVDDSIQEMDETFSVVLSNPSQGSGLADGTADGAIIDN